MTFNSFDAVLYAVTFLVPGFLWSSVLSAVVPRRVAAIEVRLLEFLTFSCINHAVWIWLIVWVFRAGLLENQPYWAGGLLVIPVLVSPLFLGWSMGRCWSVSSVRRILGRFGFRTPHPTAWDYHFSRGLPYYVIVTLRDGSRVFGLFGYRSFAGDDPAERDLYLELLFTPTKSGEWMPIQDSGGIIVKGDMIAAIEFRTHKDVEYGA